MKRKFSFLIKNDYSFIMIVLSEVMIILDSFQAFSSEKIF